MKAQIALVVLSVAFAVATFSPEVTQKFVAFQQTYNKVYANQAEYNARLAIFAENIQLASVLNANANGLTQYGITKFMDMTQEEFKSTVLMTKVPAIPKGPYHNETFAALKAPESFDWRDKAGVVTAVYNQGQCGSCWAFSATENVESRWALAGHALTRLSMQQVVSCDTNEYGCSGGLPSSAYEYIHSVGGQDTYTSYPYTAANTPCEFKKDHVDAKLKSWTYVTETKDEKEMVDYLYAHGPLSVCVDAEQWMYYKSGIFTAADCGRSIDHCVDAVGYDLHGDKKYWIIRNSWGTDWGIEGYMHLEYGKDACAVAEVATSSLPE